ncbi:hypothetical protein DVH05_007455 [Phytophthora capsici]|nr:hypothetical protein DVH05_007455 [Phytophthora capsici]
MTTTDADFLAQVESLLTSSDLPLLPSFEENSDEQMLQKPQERKSKITSGIQLTETSKHIMDAITRHEIEKAKDRNRRRAYRERRRIERENLQQEIVKLTEELQKIKRSKKRNLVLSAWEMVAQHQLAARKRSEDHQRQLHKAIDVQVALVKDFRRLAHDRVDTLGGIPIGKNSLTDKPKRVRLEATDVEIFAGYIKELSSVFTKTERILRESKLESTEPNWNDPIEIWDQDVDTGYFEFRGKITLPCDFEEICHYRWQTAHLLQDRREVYDVNDDNTLALKFRRTTHLPSGEIASVLRRLVIRRYKFEDRMVLVWRLFTEGEGFFNGMHADETGWGVITPTDHSSKTGTVLRTCVKNTPMHCNSVQKRVLQQFNQGLFQWGHENKEKDTFGLEKLILSSD